MTKRILIVEDDPGVAALLSDLLALDGHRVETADNGVSALTRLEQDSGYDLVITDLRMPGLDGWGLYREVERRYPDLLRRVIFISGSFNPVAEAARQTSPVPILRKPFALSDIRQVVRQTLDLT